MAKDPKSIVNFLFEVGMLAHTPRSGFFYLGSGAQSTSEHTTRTLYIGFVLAIMEGDVDMEKVLKLCLFHDLAEARVSDLNYVHQKYVERFEDKAIDDLAATVEFGHEITAIFNEAKEKKTKESIVTKDADNLEWILSLKEQVDIGNARAETWLPSAIKRLKTKSAQQLAETIMKTKSDEWWFNPDDNWWVTRGKK